MPKAKPGKNPKRAKRIYISDVHMGAGRKPKSKNSYPYDWLGSMEAKRFADFLDHLANSEDVQEVILLGDIMDNWVCPVDEVPPTFDEIVKASHNRGIVRNLRTLAKHKEIRLVYMPGNHDMAVTREFIEKAFPGVAFGGSAANESVYRTSRLLAEHGSAHAMFNAPDPINNSRSRLPLGYFISRCDATKASKTGRSHRHYWTYIDDFLELLGPEKIPESVFEAVLEEAGLPDDAEIKMYPVAGKAKSINAREVKAKYADLYEQWKTHHGPGMAFKAVMAEIGYLGDLADNISKKGDTNIVIFGHSHDSELDKDSWFVEDRIYANCGTWCEDKKAPTFVETEKDEEQRKHYVRLMAWEDCKQKELGKEWVVM
jgi:UDP-2,3-diacylglucosamine pyrophosphatase LpxH